MTRKLRIVFMGTPNFAVDVLKKLVENGEHIVGVITAPDKPAGRGRKLRESPVKQYAISKALPVLQPTNLKSNSFIEELKSIQANLQIVVAFRMLPKIVWSMPSLGTFNLHASLLPHYRGAAPINWVIINGEKQTGVTTFFIDKKIDTGAILFSKEIPIDKNDTAGTLHDKLMNLGSDLVYQTVQAIKKGEEKPMPQPLIKEIKEAPKLTSENTKINWTLKGQKIDQLIKGLSPYPSAWSLLMNNEVPFKVKLYGSYFVLEAHNYPVGSVLSTKKELKVAVTDGYIYLTDLQLPGKKRMEVSSLLNGYTFSKDAKFV